VFTVDKLVLYLLNRQVQKDIEKIYQKQAHQLNILKMPKIAGRKMASLNLEELK
jgi:hypothetical protein